MSWWMWLVLWIALVAVSALFLLAVGFRMFRKAMATLDEFGEASSLLDAAPPAHASGAAVVEASGSPVPAVFAQPAQVRQANHEARLLRQGRRRERRIRRRAENRRPQLLRDLPHL
ncbi:hypothetical protein E2F48_02680 [Arthrobacter crusticola]|uniref:Uncharacterized protein n=1 Tax=Arthrobacter crusticola TaxID=2547960 RepID=A0A4R5U2Z1_9MICC|nr:hypothetical protein [Arthrobacter crusticola]TDK28025.1 hypothetical protein E2F48_02680 [Arthrobacter crusticola]